MLDFEALADAPVEAFAGLSKEDAAILRQAFNISTIGDLGRNTLIIAAVAVATLAGPIPRGAGQDDTSVPRDDDLIARHIEPNPLRPGVENARLTDSGVPVWALAGYLAAVDGDVRKIAADYDLPLETVRAAIAYYRRHQAAVDARIAANTLSTAS